MCDRSHNVSLPTSTLKEQKAPQGLMPVNIPGILVPFHLLINPRLVIPALSVRGMCSVPDYVVSGGADHGRVLLACRSRRIDIRQLDFVALKAAGYRGAVVDKDNCLVRLPLFTWLRTSHLNFERFCRPCLITMNSFQN